MNGALAAFHQIVLAVAGLGREESSSAWDWKGCKVCLLPSVTQLVTSLASNLGADPLALPLAVTFRPVVFFCHHSSFFLSFFVFLNPSVLCSCPDLPLFYVPVRLGSGINPIQGLLKTQSLLLLTRTCLVTVMQILVWTETIHVASIIRLPPRVTIFPLLMVLTVINIRLIQLILKFQKPAWGRNKLSSGGCELGESGTSVPK